MCQYLVFGLLTLGGSHQGVVVSRRTSFTPHVCLVCFTDYIAQSDMWSEM